MARRNMKQIIERTTVPDKFDMTVNEWMELVREPELDAVRDGFKYGFALGMRCQKKEGKKTMEKISNSTPIVKNGYGVKTPIMDDNTFLKIRDHLETAEDGLKELAFDEGNETALYCKNEILDGIEVLEQWFSNGRAMRLNVKREI